MVAFEAQAIMVIIALTVEQRDTISKHNYFTFKRNEGRCVI